MCWELAKKKWNESELYWGSYGLSIGAHCFKLSCQGGGLGMSRGRAQAFEMPPGVAWLRGRVAVAVLSRLGLVWAVLGTGEKKMESIGAVLIELGTVD
jgi:hypothetical protein